MTPGGPRCVGGWRRKSMSTRVEPGRRIRRPAGTARARGSHPDGGCCPVASRATRPPVESPGEQKQGGAQPSGEPIGPLGGLQCLDLRDHCLRPVTIAAWCRASSRVWVGAARQAARRAARTSGSRRRSDSRVCPGGAAGSRHLVAGPAWSSSLGWRRVVCRHGGSGTAAASGTDQRLGWPGGVRGGVLAAGRSFAPARGPGDRCTTGALGKHRFGDPCGLA